LIDATGYPVQVGKKMIGQTAIFYRNATKFSTVVLNSISHLRRSSLVFMR